MAVRLIQKNDSEDVTSNDDARVNFALFGSCIFAGIGDEFSFITMSLLGGGWTGTIGTGMGCFGGRLIQVSEPETLESHYGLFESALFLVVDLRLGQERAYFTTKIMLNQADLITMADSGTFFEDGKMYAIQIWENGSLLVPKRKPGEAEYCRKIAQTGKIGNTLLTDLFTFDDDGNVTDLPKVNHTKYADTAGGIKVGSADFTMKAGLEMSPSGSRLVTTIKVVDGITIAKTPGGKSAIDTDSATQKFSISEDVRKMLVRFDDIILVSLVSSSNSSSIDGANVAINGGSFYPRDNLEMKITNNGNDRKLLVRWHKGANIKDLSSATLRFIGTIK
jgi:hypothetical protein